jgi:hypothetical protein
MSKDWLESLEKHLPTDVDHAIRDLAQRVHYSHWHPISTAPCNQELELRITEGDAILTLEFPCLRTNAGDWIDVDLGTRIVIAPVEWRVWHHRKSPESHHSPVDPKDRSALLHHDYGRTGGHGPKDE